MPPVPAGLALPADGEIFLVQLRSTSLPEFRDALQRAGAEVLQFVPHHAHVVRLSPGAAPRVAALDFVERVEPFHPGYRLEPALRAWTEGSALDAAARDAAGRVRLNVMTFAWGEKAKERLAAAAGSFGADVALWIPSGHLLEMWVPKEGLAALAAHPDVAWIDRWSAPEIDMDQGRVDAGADWLEAGTGLCGATGVRGEVMDNGVQQTHPDFDGILMHTTASTDSHGTSTFGIVFGNGARDGDGEAKGTGFLPCAGKQGIFADYDSVSDRFAHTQELKGVPYFAAFQSNSWGSATTTAYNSVSSQMDDIILNQLDIAITQSQSNTGNRNSRPQAWAKNIISVGAIRHYDTLDESDDRWNSGASIGPADDGRLKPDVHYWYDSIYTTTTNSGYNSGFGGTSGATPMVAGVLGLMAEMWADNVWGTDPIGSTVFDKLPHHTSLKALLVNNARQYAFNGTDVDLSRYKQGWGRPNVQIAKERAPRSFVVDWDDPLSVGQRATYDLRVAASESELKITMIYPDPSGTTSATLHRINDVNLKVIGPSGTIYHGNVGLEAGNYSVAGGSPDVVDTVENVFVMTMFSAAILAMQRESLFVKRYNEGMKKDEYWDATYEDAANLLAKLPSIAAIIYRLKYKDDKQITADPNLDWGGNFAHQMGFKKPYDDVARMYFILHSDHESGNVSAHTTHLVASALSDAYYALSAFHLLGHLRGARAVRPLPDQRRQFDAGPRPGPALPHRRERRPRGARPRELAGLQRDPSHEVHAGLRLRGRHA